MITKDDFVTISDLRDKTSQVMKSTSKSGKKIILSQNKPIGVLLNIDEYNALKKVAFSREDATIDDINIYKKSSHGERGVDAFDFLNTL